MGLASVRPLVSGPASFEDQEPISGVRERADRYAEDPARTNLFDDPLAHPLAHSLFGTRFLAESLSPEESHPRPVMSPAEMDRVLSSERQQVWSHFKHHVSLIAAYDAHRDVRHLVGAARAARDAADAATLIQDGLDDPRAVLSVQYAQYLLYRRAFEVSGEAAVGEHIDDMLLLQNDVVDQLGHLEAMTTLVHDEATPMSGEIITTSGEMVFVTGTPNPAGVVLLSIPFSPVRA